MNRRFIVIAFATILASLPGAALAQDVPSRPEPASADDATLGGPTGTPSGIVDSCGHALVPGVRGDQPLLPGGVNPTTRPELDVKDENSQPQNVSTVSGTIVHAEGNLLLVQMSQIPAAGASRPQGTLAVVRLPADCAAGPLMDGTKVDVTGVPSADGILTAQTFQLGQ